MVGHVPTGVRSDFFLPRLDDIIDELGDLAALDADHVVMVLTFIELEHRLSTFEIEAIDQTGSLELGQDAIDRRDAYFLALFEQRLVQVFRRHVPLWTALEQFQHLDPRQRHLESGFPEVLGFHWLYLISYHLRNMTARLRIVTVIAVAILLQACGWAYRPAVNQGNYLTAEIVDQVQVGMTRDQVRDLLGFPVAKNPFRDDRWDFVFFHHSSIAEYRRSYMVVWFDAGRVARIETREAPSS